MADSLSPTQRHFCMSSVHSFGTKPEKLLRRILWHKGFRYRVNDKRLPASPDIVLPKYKTVVFVHGCFWHGHKGCKSFSTPKTNTDYWTMKVRRNQERDQETWRQLEAKGWNVIIVWECELKKARFQDTVDRVVAEIRRNGEILISEKESRKEARALYLKERRQQKEREQVLKQEISQKFLH